MLIMIMIIIIIMIVIIMMIIMVMMLIMIMMMINIIMAAVDADAAGDLAAADAARYRCGGRGRTRRTPATVDAAQSRRRIRYGQLNLLSINYLNRDPLL